MRDEIIKLINEVNISTVAKTVLIDFVSAESWHIARSFAYGYYSADTNIKPVLDYIRAACIRNKVVPGIDDIGDIIYGKKEKM